MKINKRGISLIVLVITIIVMIILATSIILSLNGSGIIGRANKAKKDTDYQSAKEVAVMAKVDWDLMSDEQKIANGGTFSVYAQTRLQQAGFPESGNGSYEVTNEGVVYAYPVIPSGFVASKYTGETKVSEGLVVYKANEGLLENCSQQTAMEEYDQYVWIPVDNINKFVRRDGYSDGTLQTLVSNNTTTELFTSANLSATNDLTGEFAEWDAVVKSIEKYGGFYIGRYETGTTEKRTTSSGTSSVVMVRKGKYVYNCVGWGLSATDVESNIAQTGKSAVKLAREMSTVVYQNNSVVSHLLYGSEWDAVVNFMKDVKNPSGTKSNLYVYDSTGMGWYYNNPASGNSDHKTGIDIGQTASNKVKNIYDMGGNVVEWTMETYLMGTSGYRVFRGGNYQSSPSYSPMSNRNYQAPTNAAVEQYGFRIALYIK